MKIAFVAGEFNPIIKHTGLGSVVRDLASELAGQGHKVSVLLPYFGAVDENASRHYGIYADDSRWVDDIVRFGGKRGRAQLANVPKTLTGVRDIWLLNSGDILETIRNVGTGGRIVWSNHFDTDGRFLSDELALAMMEFNRLAAALLSGQYSDWLPDIIHCIGWEAALVPSFLMAAKRPVPPCVLTVDLLTVQGKIETAQEMSLREAYEACQVPFSAGINNFLRQGIRNASLLHLPSDQWLQEIITGAHICKVSKELKRRMDDVCVAPFAINADSLHHCNKLRNETTVPGALMALDRVTMDFKRWGKSEVQRRLGLPLDSGPILLTGNRISEDDQKNYDLLVRTMDALLGRWPGLQLILRLFPRPADSSSSAARRWRNLEALVRRFHSPNRAVIDSLDDPNPINWALLLLGSDVVLLPSRFEPAGLNHREAMFYGCAVGGTRKWYMANTIKDLRDQSAFRPNGWLFDCPDDDQSFVGCIDDAVRRYAKAYAWEALVSNCLATPVTWKDCIDQYLQMYARLFQKEDEAPNRVRGSFSLPLPTTNTVDLS